MDLDNTKSNEIIHKEFKKCRFCGKELIPIGLDYLYANISPDAIKYERCNCNEAQEYWKKIDEQEYEIEKRKHYKNIINKMSNPVKNCRERKLVKTFNNGGFLQVFPSRIKIQTLFENQKICLAETLPAKR